MIPPFQALALSILLMGIGILGVLIRRNLIFILLSFEIILNAINLALVSFSQLHGNLDGQVIAVFIIAIAACEAALGLAIAVFMFRTVLSIRTDKINLLKG